MEYRIALAGNPNSGKTTLFNALTGMNQYVGNWPGVTVEKKEGKLKSDKNITIIDLPGIYSLSPYTLEEVVSRNFLLTEKVDVILNIIDGTNLERNLYLTTQLVELGLPVVVAVNMLDITRKNGDVINIKELEKIFNLPFVEISALKGEGLNDVIEEVLKAARNGKSVPYVSFSAKVEETVRKISVLLSSYTDASKLRWYSIKFFERDEKMMEMLSVPESVKDQINTIAMKLTAEEDEDAESLITAGRYDFISSVIKSCYKKKNKGLTLSDKIDHIVTNRILALPIFALVMWIVYYVSVSSLGAIATDYVNDTIFGESGIPYYVSMLLEMGGVAPWLSGLILDGIIAGVGAVLGFVPQMLILFFFLAILEGCGYMARIAFIMDRVFRKFGLSGKSFIPMLIGSGCGVPGIMASRTIENERDRRMTIMTTTFIPCSAKLPIIALIAGSFFGSSGWVAFSAYFLGIFAVILSGVILKKTKRFEGEASPFVMELPAYHIPTVGYVLRSMWERGWSFIKKAGTVIFISSIAIWFLSYFGFKDGSFGMLEAEELDFSILAYIGRAFAWIFTPLGWGEWRFAVAAITGLVAKENVVGTFGILFHHVGELSEAGDEIWTNLSSVVSPIAAYSYLVFNLLCAPCFAAMGAIKREMNNGKWFAFAIFYQCVFAYLMALVIYQFGLLFTGSASWWLIAAIIVVIYAGYMLFRKPKRI